MSVAGANDREFGRVRVLTGSNNGKYPHGNSLLIRGSDATAIIDPSLSVYERREELRGAADVVVLSHAHEDHLAGLSLFPEASVQAHREDLLGVQRLDGLLEMYGYGDLSQTMSDWVVSQFHYTPRPDARAFQDDGVIDLGGVRIRAIHTPGHTRGHCVLAIEPDGVLFLGDIELSSFGPYYGDAWSNLADFEHSIERVRALDARVWVSFHHVGVIEDRPAFDARLDRFASRIQQREQQMLAYLEQPRSIDELVHHRFLYPAHADLPFIDAVERRTIDQHLDRLERQGRISRRGDSIERIDGDA